MEDLTKIVAARLSKLFENETQTVTARKLSSTQSNISKYVNGQQLPPADTLKEIAKAYNVSIDWVLGISDDPEINGVLVEELTYEQSGRIIDYLIKIGAIEVPDVKEIVEVIGEEVLALPDDSNILKKKDSDIIKIKDRALSHMLRRRLKMYEMGEDMGDTWRENNLPKFRGLKLLTTSENMQAAIDSRNWTGFTDGDWVSTINELSKLSDEELLILVAALNKEKDGRENG